MSKMDLVEFSRTNMQGALLALWERIEYIGRTENKRPDDEGGDWRRNLACAGILTELKYLGVLPQGFQVAFVEIYDPAGPKPPAIEGVQYTALKGGKHPITGQPLKAGDRVVPHLFNIAASVLHLLCEQDADLAVQTIGQIDYERAFKPGETLRILCGHGMKEEAVAHLRNLCHEDRDYALNVAHDARCDEFPLEDRLAVLAEEGITTRKRGSSDTPKSYVDNPEQQRTTLGDKLRGTKLVIGQPVDSNDGSNDDDGGMSASAAVA